MEISEGFARASQVMTNKARAFEQVFEVPCQNMRNQIRFFPKPLTAHDNFFVERFSAYIERTLVVWRACFFDKEGGEGLFIEKELFQLNQADGESLMGLLAVCLIRITMIAEKEMGDRWLQLLFMIKPKEIEPAMLVLAAHLKPLNAQEAENLMVRTFGQIFPSLLTNPLNRMMFVMHVISNAALHHNETLEAFEMLELTESAKQSFTPSTTDGLHASSARKPLLATTPPKSSAGWLASAAIAVIVIICRSLGREHSQTTSGTGSGYPTVPPSSPSTLATVQTASHSSESSGNPSASRIIDHYYLNDFLGVSVPIPPNWLSDTPEERKRKAELVLGELSKRNPGISGAPFETVLMIHPKEREKWSFVPSLNLMTERQEGYPGMTSPFQYAEYLSEQLKATQPLTRAGAPYTLGIFSALDYATPSPTGTVIQTCAIAFKRGNIMVFTVSAGDEATWGKLRSLLAEVKSY